MNQYTLEDLLTYLDTVWVTDTGIPVILSDITGDPAKGEISHIHFEVISTRKTIVRTLDEVQSFIKV